MQTEIKNITCGSIVKIDKNDYVVLEHDKDATCIMIKESVSYISRECSDVYAYSELRHATCEVGNFISFDTKVVVPHVRMVGDIDYGNYHVLTDKYFIPTLREFIEWKNHNVIVTCKDNWWLADSPLNTKYFLGVSPKGYVKIFLAEEDKIGIRFCCWVKNDLKVTE